MLSMKLTFIVVLMVSQSRADHGDSNDPLDWLRAAVPGEPGVDYPVFADVQATSFSCRGNVVGGYYADPAMQCQAYHVCLDSLDGEDRKISFLCPNGTIFNQELFTCDWWFNVDCGLAESFYASNLRIGTEEEAVVDATASRSGSQVTRTSVTRQQQKATSSGSGQTSGVSLGFGNGGQSVSSQGISSQSGFISGLTSGDQRKTVTITQTRPETVGTRVTTVTRVQSTGGPGSIEGLGQQQLQLLGSRGSALQSNNNQQQQTVLRKVTKTTTTRFDSNGAGQRVFESSGTRTFDNQQQRVNSLEGSRGITNRQQPRRQQGTSFRNSFDLVGTNSNGSGGVPVILADPFQAGNAN